VAAAAVPCGRGRHHASFLHLLVDQQFTEHGLETQSQTVVLAWGRKAASASWRAGCCARGRAFPALGSISGVRQGNAGVRPGIAGVSGWAWGCGQRRVGACFSQQRAESCGTARVLVSLGSLSRCCRRPPFSARGALAENGEPALGGTGLCCVRVPGERGDATLRIAKWGVSRIYRATDVQVCSFLVPPLAYEKTGPDRLLLCVEPCFLFGNQILAYKVHSRISVV